jgi:endonuclease/exonuclease/phosphatase family metal-dependent hydrolase
LGVQEALFHQVLFMDNVMENYTYLGVGRDDGKLSGEFAPVFYDSTNVKLLYANTIWLSETIDTVSIGWDAALPRICSYGLFEIKSTQQKIWVFNTHFDHMGEIARAESAKVLLNQIAKENKAQYPVILMGDFNCTENLYPYNIFYLSLKMRNLLQHYHLMVYKVHLMLLIPYLFLKKCIDFIFVEGIQVKSLEHSVTKTKNGLWLSDHLPVVGVLEL